MSKVKIVRLQSGEEIICKVSEGSKKGTICLNKAAIIIPVGQGQIGLSPFMPYATFPEKGLEVKDTHVMFIIEPVEEFLNEYNTAFGSGLVVPGSGEVASVSGSIPNLKIAD